MNRLCTYPTCKVVVVGNGSRCPDHPYIRPVKAPQPHSKGIYSSSKWKRLRNRFIANNPLCVHCERIGLIRPATVVDHIVEIRDGGDVWNTDNYQSLCRDCHQIKTGMEQRRRRDENRLNGFNNLSDF